MNDLKNIQLQRKFNILLIGDSCIDEYYYGTCDRLNPEAPVPVLKITNRSQSYGMAANVKSNLEALGCEVDFRTGDQLSIKRRYIDERSKQHIVRVDEDKKSTPFESNTHSLEYAQYDAVVISDYNKGFVTYCNIQSVREQFSGPIFIDSKKTDLQKFQGCFVKINEQEFNKATSLCTDLIVTLGSKGAEYNNKIYTTRKANMIDVCGAGDTFLAALTYQYLKSTDIEQSIRFANYCASITVEHRGVYALTQSDIDSIII